MRRGLWVALGGCFWVTVGLAQQPSRGGAEDVVLDPLLIGGSALDERYDPTGMGGPDTALIEPPFSNDLLGAGATADEFSLEQALELQLATGVSPVDLATGVNRVNLRGFPTPRLRNGFGQTGIPEVLNVERVELIQGPLTPVTGRAAPGGIQNFVTARPRAKPQSRLEISVSSLDAAGVRWETNGVLRKNRLWQRWAAGWQEKSGPETFASTRTRWVSGALTYKHSRRVSMMFTLDYSEVDGNPSPGVPEYRETARGKVMGPYRPLASFHGYGPHGGIDKRVLAASVQFEAQLTPRISARASLQGLKRHLVDERFTTSQFILETGKFGGVREPLHGEQPFAALTLHSELTGRWTFLSLDHKVSVAVDHVHTDYERRQFGLERSDRDALPVDVRSFDPAAPNYYRPAFDAALYRRIVTDRAEVADYSSLLLSDRAAAWHGRLVASAGVRFDFVTLDVDDRKPGTSMPRVNDDVSEITRFFGVNYQLVKNRLLAFATASTAFEPSTRVDARTGRIQGNETTLGYEAGLKGLFWKQRLTSTLLLFQFSNQNISRRNPLFDDPIADQNQTQPQLVAAGEERFTGGTLDLRAQLTPAWTVTSRFTLTEAITTRSPDLPEEIGRALTRLPRTTFGASTRYAFSKPAVKGLWVSGSVNYVGSYVAYYESSSRAYLAFPGYTLLGLNTGYAWKTGKSTQHNLGVGLRNALGVDLLAKLGRPGAGREFTANYTLVF
jgi:iron complex outermembrane recepter protein